MKLTKRGDSKYYGAHHGREVVVWQERTDRRHRKGMQWIANSDEMLIGERSTRRDAVEAICRMIDCAAQPVPELDQLLARLTNGVEEVIARLPTGGERTLLALNDLNQTLRWLDGSVRSAVVHFEGQLAKLGADVGTQDASEGRRRLKNDCELQG
jgi:hypothetical protein